MRLFLILLIVPIIEIALFIEVGGLIGTWPTVGIIIVTALIGSWMLRRQGLQALHGVQSRIQAGDGPGQVLAEGAMILFAGALLLTPGFFTDAVGFLLLIPGVRSAVWSKIATRIEAQAATTTHAEWHFTSATGPGGGVVDGEFTEVRTTRPVNNPGPPPIDTDAR